MCEQMKKKLINFRAVFVFATLLALGLFYAKDVFSGEASGIILVGLVLIFFLIWAIKDKSFFKFVVPVVAFVVGVGLFAVCDATYFRGVVTDGEFEVRGRVEYVNNDYGTTQSFILGDVEVAGKSQSKNIYVYYQKHGKTLEVGDEIKFVGTLEKVKLWNEGGFNSFYYKNKISSFCRLSSSAMTNEGNNKKLSEKFQSAVKDTLQDNMIQENAAVAYASIFGDKSGIDEQIQNAFSGVGVAHLLAISGLHIGFFVGLLSFVLSKCRLHKKWHVFVVAPILFVYCYLCRFSPSVLRATIMSIMLLLSHSFGRKNDALTTFSVALIVCLLFRPLDIFDGGLQLSFLCVFSLILLTPIIQKIFDKIKLNKVGKILSPILAVQIGILPVMMKLFKSVSLLTILANMICVPIFEVAYIMLMVLLPFSFIPHFGVILVAPEFLLHTISMTAIDLSEKSAMICLPYLGKDVSFLYIFLMFGLSRFVMTNLSKKMMLATGLVCVMAFVFFASYFQNTQQNNSMLVVGSDEIFVLNVDNQKLLVDLSGNLESAESGVVDCLRFLKIYHIDTYVGTGEQDVSSFSQLKRSRIVTNTVQNFEYFKITDKINAVKLVCGSKKFLFVTSLKDETEKEIMQYHFEQDVFDVVINLTQIPIDPNARLKFDQSDFKNENWTISFDCATLGEKRSLI